MASEIKTRLALEGAREFKKGFDDAAAAVKVLNSEQKLAEAQFRNTGDAMQFAADKTRILKEKITEQQRAVDAAQGAIKKLTDSGVDPNSDAVRKWTTHLNTAKTRLLNLQTQLNNTETELTEQKSAIAGVSGEYDGLLATTQDIDKKITLEQAKQAVESLRAKVAAVGQAAIAAGKTLWDWQVGAGQWAKDLTAAASAAGVDVETYQSWQYASLYIGTEVGKITSAREALTAKMSALADEDVLAFNEIGVATRDADGSIRDSTRVFFDTIDALARYTDQTERAVHAEKIFGSGWRDLAPLIDAGSQTYNQYAEEGRQVAVVCEDNVAALAAFDDAQRGLNAELQKTKYDLLAETAPALQKAAEAMKTAVEGFNAFLQTDEGQAALDRLSTAFGSVVKQLTSVDSEAQINGAAAATQKFADALAWIGDHGDAAKTVLIGLGAAWGGLTISKDVITFLQLLQSINWLHLRSAGGGAGAVSTAASAAGSSAGAKLLGATGTALVVASGVDATLHALQELQEQGTLLGIGQRDEDGYMDVGGIGIPVSGRAIKDVWSNYKKNANVAYNWLADGVIDIGDRIGDLFRPKGKSSETDYAPYEETGQQIYNEILDAVQRGMDAAAYTQERYGSRELGEKFAEGQSVLDAVKNEARMPGTDEAIANYRRQLYADLGAMAAEESERMQQAGADGAAGFAAGIAAGTEDAASAAATMAQGTVDAVQEALDEHSPSRVMETLGVNAAIGLANGIYNRGSEAIAAATWVANQVAAIMRSALTIDAQGMVMAPSARLSQAVNGMLGAAGSVPVSAAQAGGGAYRGAAENDMRAYIVMDKTVVGEMVAPAVDGYLGAQLASRR